MDGDDTLSASDVFPWPEVWRALAAAIQTHAESGRMHLLTEDSLRFGLIMALEEQGIAPGELRVEEIEPQVGGKLDLVIGRPIRTAFELKFPRGSRTGSSPDTMIYGDLLKDFYRLARLNCPDRWVVQLITDRLRGFLERRTDTSWTFNPGDTFELRSGLPLRLPETARRSLPSWAADQDVRAECVAAHRVRDATLATYRLDD